MKVSWKSVFLSMNELVRVSKDLLQMVQVVFSGRGVDDYIVKVGGCIWAVGSHDDSD